MSPFRNETATLEERLRRLGETALTLEQEGAELGSERRRQPTSWLAFLVAAGLIALAFGVGDRVGSIACETSVSWRMTLLLGNQARTLDAEAKLGRRCDLASTKEKAALLRCQSALVEPPAGGGGRDPAP